MCTANLNLYPFTQELSAGHVPSACNLLSDVLENEMDRWMDMFPVPGAGDSRVSKTQGVRSKGGERQQPDRLLSGCHTGSEEK